VLSASIESDLEQIPTTSPYGAWAIFPYRLKVMIAKELIPNFEEGGQLESWLENRIRDLLTCPSMIRLNNMIGDWETTVVINNPESEVDEADFVKTGGYEETIFEFKATMESGVPSTHFYVSGKITFDRFELTSPMTMLFTEAHTVDRWAPMMNSVYVKLINSEYFINPAKIEESMSRRWISGVWVDECQFELMEDLPRGQPYLELRYNKPTGFGFDPSWVTVLHSNSLLGLLG